MSASGIEIIAACIKAVTWGTAVELGVNNGILIQPHSIKKGMSSLVDDSLGLYFPQESDNSQIDVKGGLPAYLRYDSLDLLIAMVCGSTGGAPVQQGAVPAYKQTFPLAKNNDGLFVTFGVYNGVNVDEYVTVKLTGFTITGETGKAVTISFDGIAYDRITGSAVNTTVTFANVTIPETGNRVLYGQGVIRMNDQDGVALASPGDVIYPSKFELKFSRNEKGVYGLGDLDHIDEPTNDGIPTTTLALTFPRYNSAVKTYFDNWDAAVNKKLDAVFTGAQIAAPYNRTFQIEFPNLKISNVDLPIVQGILSAPLTFDCLGCATAPIGMTVTDPFLITMINQQSTDVLA